MHTFKINGTQVLFPTGLDYNLEDLHTKNSGRSELTGLMILKVLRSNVRSYSLKWEFVTEKEASTISKLVKSGDYFTVTIHDILNNTDETFTYYCGGISATNVAFVSGKIYYSLSISVIQK